MNKNYLSLALGLLLTGLCYAQDKYRIEYDYNTETATYLSLSSTNVVQDTLIKPRIKRNSLVEIKLLNVNPFAVDVLTEVKEEDLQPAASGFNFSSLLGGISGMSGDNLGLNVSQSSLGDPNFFTAGSRGASVSSGVTELTNKMAAVRALDNTLKANLINPNLDKDAILANAKALARIKASEAAVKQKIEERSTALASKADADLAKAVKLFEQRFKKKRLAANKLKLASIEKKLLAKHKQAVKQLGAKISDPKVAAVAKVSAKAPAKKAAAKKAVAKKAPAKKAAAKKAPAKKAAPKAKAAPAAAAPVAAPAAEAVKSES